jgi:hypothetical protein
MSCEDYTDRTQETEPAVPPFRAGQAEQCRRAVEGAAEVYNLAADMGGMGFIERFRIECLRTPFHESFRLRSR